MCFFAQLPVTYLLSTITTIVLVAYAILLYRITGRNRSADKLVGAFTIVFLLGTVYHLWLFGLIANAVEFLTYDSLMSRVLFSVQYSLEMFLANTLLFKGEVKEVLQEQAFMFQGYLVLYGMAILTSGFSIFHFLSRRLFNWLWLTFHNAKNKAHIFIGINDASLCLAGDIMENYSGERVIFIDLPDQQDNPQGMSIWDIVGGFFKDSKEHKELNNYVVLKAGKGIDKITKWLKKEDNDVYILSGNQEHNITILESLWERRDLKCNIYCHAKREGMINRYDSIADVKNRIRFIDSSFLSVVSLKKSKDNALLPVNYVDIAQYSDTGRKLGYVTSEFHCAVIGFGETGKEALRFLYEFGAFPDKNNGKVPFKCHIFDNNLAKELGEFGIDLTTLRSPLAMEPEFKLHSCGVNTLEFHTEISKIIGKLNYIIICLGNDNLNIETALDIVECAAIESRDTGDKFCIAIKQSKISKLNQDTLKNANRAYKNCIHPFGLTEEIWKMHFIKTEELDKNARIFYESYSKLSDIFNQSMGWNPNPTWDERDKMGIRSEIYEERCKARRQKMQDYSNCLHKTTKQLLCNPYDGLAEQILTINEGSHHCKEEDVATKNILEHLAVCEHLRWEASHLMMGYKPTTGNTDDLKKLHCCLKPCNELSEAIIHYDWLVVKNSLATIYEPEKNSVQIEENEYVPQPINTDGVRLPEELDKLAELIAENVHEVWAKSRMEEGWTYGEERNDKQRKHPCLVPYKELPEEEKAYDRNTALGTLKLINKLGFKISGSTHSSVFDSKYGGEKR